MEEKDYEDLWPVKKTEGKIDWAWIVFCICCLVLLTGCVRTVYLPETAAYYRAQLERCMTQKSKCERDILDCIDKCDELELYVPSSSVESSFARKPVF